MSEEPEELDIPVINKKPGKVVIKPVSDEPEELDIPETLDIPRLSDKSRKIQVEPGNSELAAGSGIFSRNTLYKGLESLANVLEDLADQAERWRVRLSDPDATTGSPPPTRRGGSRPLIDLTGVLDYLITGRRAEQPSTATGFSTSGLTATPVPGSTREPLVDIFDEKADGLIMVVAEMPGVDEESIAIEIEGDILNLKARGDRYNYEKECMLPAPVLPVPLSKGYQNGVLELRLKRE
jgi:HSP20 family protein